MVGTQPSVSLNELIEEFKLEVIFAPENLNDVLIYFN